MFSKNQYNPVLIDNHVLSSSSSTSSKEEQSSFFKLTDLPEKSPSIQSTKSKAIGASASDDKDFQVETVFSPKRSNNDMDMAPSNNYKTPSLKTPTMKDTSFFGMGGMGFMSALCRTPCAETSSVPAVVSVLTPVMNVSEEAGEGEGHEKKANSTLRSSTIRGAEWTPADDGANISINEKPHHGRLSKNNVQSEITLILPEQQGIRKSSKATKELKNSKY